MCKLTIRKDRVLEKIQEARDFLAKAEILVKDCKQSDLSQTGDDFQKTVLRNINYAQNSTMRAKFEMYRTDDDIPF